MPEISFKYQAPTAGKHSVGITGDFTDWEILDLIDLGGIYILKLDVEPGLYRYKLIVDGNWIADPGNPRQEPDPFGGQNSILEVGSEITLGLSWKQAREDLSLLDKGQPEHLELNRLKEREFELRFNWQSSLEGILTAWIDGREHPLFRSGETGNRAVWHCRFSNSQAEVGILIQVQTKDVCLWWGEGGFTFLRDEAKPLLAKLSTLPVFSVPDWVRSAVIYQIFPDRFRNGDPANDPDFSEDYYADCRTPPPPGEMLSPQTEYYHLVKDWNDISGLKQSPWLAKGTPDWWSFHGGDLAGVRQKLPYLVDLGINVIYFNPLWQAKSNHKYDALDFRRVDPHFGGDKELRALVREAREVGIRVILDVAFNHTGADFPAFRDCVEKGPESEYWHWYDWFKWPLPDPLPADFKAKEHYQCWWGIKDMPDLNFDLSRVHPAENHVKDIHQAVPNQPLVEHILECARWWLLEMDVDGFRLDIPDEVPYWFWELFRAQVKKWKPQAWIVGEIWQSARGWVGSRYFDSVMNYAYFKDPVLEHFILEIIDQNSFLKRIREGLAQYPLQAAEAMMNLLGSHDTVRIHELAKGKTDRLKLALLFQMTFVGAPHIYYGDEIGMPGGRDPDNRRPFNWDWETEKEARELREHYQALIRLRKCDPLFTEGEFRFLPGADGLLAWQRYDSSASITVAANLSAEELLWEGEFRGLELLRLGKSTQVSQGVLLQPGAALVTRRRLGKGEAADVLD